MINFSKYQASGNDFILIEDANKSFLSHYAHHIPFLCDRHLGIGADGIILLQPSSIADCKMRIFNSDGSEASMCGNALASITKHKKTSLLIETNAGISKATFQGNTLSYSFPKAEILSLNIVLDENFLAHHLDTGTPHLVIFVNQLSNDLMENAKTIRYDNRFKEGVNVNFAHIQGDQIYLRTYEKGVERETLSCGTGGAATALAYYAITKKNDLIEIVFASKESAVYSLNSSGLLEVKTNASFVFSGMIPLLKYNASPECQTLYR